MRPISWLHISDIHLRPLDAWPQKIVMEAMCESIKRCFAHGPADFILVSGDLAFSGKIEDYALVETFLDNVGVAAGVQRERVFFIPGNHDIDRSRQRLCFRGARAALLDEGRTDSFLGDPTADDFQTLLQREQQYRVFQTRYCAGQDRTTTGDGLGYVAWLSFDGIRLALLGLDSAWLAEGGTDDHLKLLVGERQVINALELIRENADAPHIVVAMAHHPLHLLQDFDRRHVLQRIEGECHFLHCGHLHAPEERPAGQSPGGCLTVAAGASFESRQSPNSYGVITVDLLQGTRTLVTHRYDPVSGGFASSGTTTYQIEVRPLGTCGLTELASALQAAMGTPWPTYLAALLLDKKADVPVKIGASFTMARAAILSGLPDHELREITRAFFTFRNALRVLYGRVPLDGILRDHGNGIAQYCAKLAAIAEADTGLKTKLDAQEADAGVLAHTEPQSSFAHTLDLLADLARAKEWEALREAAARHIDGPDHELATRAKRMLALALASSGEGTDKRQAIDLYRALADGQNSDPTDAGNLATLLSELDSVDDAKIILLQAIAMGPASATDYYNRIGQRIVEATGDKEFRSRLTTAIAQRAKA